MKETKGEGIFLYSKNPRLLKSRTTVPNLTLIYLMYRKKIVKSQIKHPNLKYSLLNFLLLQELGNILKPQTVQDKL